jgi:F0F1-type ATP synthase membrane subunit c/vacuolar-type H+-ATPase subunit K
MNKFLILLTFLILLLITATPLLATTNEQSYSTTYAVQDSQATDGDILFSKDGSLIRANNAYSSQIFGAAQKLPVVVYRNGDPNKLAIAREGLAEVNVTTLNGEIKKGDYITASEIEGKGQKATQSGYVLGVSQENFSNSDGTQLTHNGNTYASGKIQVAVRIEYAEINTSRGLQRLLDYFNAALFKNLQNPAQFTQLIRYLFAGIIATLAFAIGYITFSRSLARSIEAVGRNPLARSTIMASLILNIALTVFVTLVGAGLAILLIRL